MAQESASAGTPASGLSRFRLLIEILIAVAAAFSAWRLSTADLGKRQAETATVIHQDDRAARKQLSELQLSVYKEVIDALKADDKVRANHIAAAQALVNGLLRDDELLQSQLMSALSLRAPDAAQQTALREQAQAYQVIASEQAVLAERAPKADAAPRTTAPVAGAWDEAKAKAMLQRWDVDLFFCEGSAADKALADAAKIKLDALQVFDRVRPRVLKREVNNLPGYRIRGYQIAYTPDEETQANALRFLLRQHTGQELGSREVRSRTDYYLSVFYCGAAKPAAADSSVAAS